MPEYTYGGTALDTACPTEKKRARAANGISIHPRLGTVKLAPTAFACEHFFESRSTVPQRPRFVTLRQKTSAHNDEYSYHGANSLAGVSRIRTPAIGMLRRCCLNLTMQVINELAEHLENAELQARDVAKITDAYPNMDWEDAYAIQDKIRLRKEARGIRIVGFKAGLTSHAKMKQMGVDSPIFGFLSDYFAVPDGGQAKMANLIHPKVEPEIAFVLKTPLKGPGCDIHSVLAATDYVAPALEIIDSRYRDFKFDLKSVVADNCSASRFVIGGRGTQVDRVDLPAVNVVMEKNGTVVASGVGAAVVDHPAAAVAMLANIIGKRGLELPAGSVILSGSITEAIAVKSGDCVVCRVQGMDSVSVHFV
jgi:2-oxo-3-hexenedioate decarboxylase